MLRAERDRLLASTTQLIGLEERKLATMRKMVKALELHLADDEIVLGPYPQRSDYMHRAVTHEAYYRSLAYTAGITYDTSDLLPRVLVALAQGDEHLNTIPLALWDKLAEPSPRLNYAFKAHGDHYSLAGGVCVHKQAAITSTQPFTPSP